MLNSPRADEGSVGGGQVIGYAISSKQGNRASDTLLPNPRPDPILGEHSGDYTEGGTGKKRRLLGKAMSCRGKKGVDALISPKN